MTCIPNPHLRPVPPDLVDVTPLHYPIVESRRFGSVRAMCKRMGWPFDEVCQFIDMAALNRSDLVVIDRLTLGDPDDKVCAVLVLLRGGAVILCAGFFGEASEDREAVESLAEEFAAAPEFKGKFVGIGEFRSNPRGLPQ